MTFLLNSLRSTRTFSIQEILKITCRFLAPPPINTFFFFFFIFHYLLCEASAYKWVCVALGIYQDVFSPFINILSYFVHINEKTGSEWILPLQHCHRQNRNKSTEQTQKVKEMLNPLTIQAKIVLEQEIHSLLFHRIFYPSNTGKGCRGFTEKTPFHTP